MGHVSRNCFSKVKCYSCKGRQYIHHNLFELSKPWEPELELVPQVLVLRPLLILKCRLITHQELIPYGPTLFFSTLHGLLSIIQNITCEFELCWTLGARDPTITDSVWDICLDCCWTQHMPIMTLDATKNSNCNSM